jgi:hypothetical protein
MDFKLFGFPIFWLSVPAERLNHKRVILTNINEMHVYVISSTYTTGFKLIVQETLGHYTLIFTENKFVNT